MRRLPLILAVRCVRMLALLLPRVWHFRLASALGSLCCKFSKRRAMIIRRNFRWCFPEYTQKERQTLYHLNLYYLGLSFFDTAVAWFWSDEAIRKHVPHTVVGLDAFLEVQKNSNCGILMMGKHSQHMELDARILGLYVTGYGVARGSDSPLVDALMQYGRGQTAVAMGDRTNPRQFFRWLKSGHTVGYYPDQDYGVQRCTMTTLFGVPATFTTAPYTLKKISGCLLYFFDSYYENGRLVIHIEPVDCSMSSPDAFTQDLARFIEQKIAQYPQDYLWIHRRFKSTKGKVSYGAVSGGAFASIMDV